MVSVLTLGVVYLGFQPWMSHTKDYAIFIPLRLEYDQRLTGSESEQCVRVGRRVYLLNVASVV